MRLQERQWHSHGQSSGRSARYDQNLLNAQSAWLLAGKSVKEQRLFVSYMILTASENMKVKIMICDIFLTLNVIIK